VRALARDTRRLSRLAETDLPQLLEAARSVAANAELLTEDLAVRLEQSRLAPEPPPRHPPDMPVQSGDTAEGQQIA
jgi:hypothetical protein